MPSVQVDDVDIAMNDNEIVTELEHVMSDWCAALTDVMQREADKSPTGTGPLAGLCMFAGRSLWCLHRRHYEVLPMRLCHAAVTADHPCWMRADKFSCKRLWKHRGCVAGRSDAKPV